MWYHRWLDILSVREGRFSCGYNSIRRDEILCIRGSPRLQTAGKGRDVRLEPSSNNQIVQWWHRSGLSSLQHNECVHSRHTSTLSEVLRRMMWLHYVDTIIPMKRCTHIIFGRNRASVKCEFQTVNPVTCSAILPLIQRTHPLVRIRQTLNPLDGMPSPIPNGFNRAFFERTRCARSPYRYCCSVPFSTMVRRRLTLEQTQKKPQERRRRRKGRKGRRTRWGMFSASMNA